MTGTHCLRNPLLKKVALTLYRATGEEGQAHSGRGSPTQVCTRGSQRTTGSDALVVLTSSLSFKSLPSQATLRHVQVCEQTALIPNAANWEKKALPCLLSFRVIPSPTGQLSQPRRSLLQIFCLVHQVPGPILHLIIFLGSALEVTSSQIAPWNT